MSSEGRAIPLRSIQTNVQKYAAGNAMLSSMGQSVENGSLPAAMAAFSPQALAGDLWAPKFQEKGGPPVKVIEERSDVDRKAKEILTLTPANQKNVWKWCEEALNIKFDV